MSCETKFVDTRPRFLEVLVQRRVKKDTGEEEVEQGPDLLQDTEQRLFQ